MIPFRSKYYQRHQVTVGTDIIEFKPAWMLEKGDALVYATLPGSVPKYRMTINGRQVDTLFVAKSNGSLLSRKMTVHLKPWLSEPGSMVVTIKNTDVVGVLLPT